jgi:hypothetical protein
MHRLTLLVTPIVLAVLLGACAAPAPTPTPAPTAKPTAAPTTAPAATIAKPTTAPTTAPAATTAPTTAPAATAAPTKAPATTGGNTAGPLADLGKAVFAKSCARCHGDQGQGANALAIIGASANLARYETAKGLYTKISTTMPKAAPGSLQAAEYQQLLGFLLLQNKLVQSDTALDDSALAGIALKK